MLPMSRREECPGCNADQHVCKMCVHYDSRNRGSCNEERAESVSDRERANFCDYFKPSNGAFNAASLKQTQDAKAKFAALFGDEPTDKAVEVSPAADMQESPDQKVPEALSSKQLAEQKLRDLLGE
ncbi:MAG: hypothetical protein ACI8Z9_001592 [Paraglaciecola sp.]|jgi:hypothetical protein